MLISTVEGDILLDPIYGNCYIGSNVEANIATTRGWVRDNCLSKTSGWSGSFTNTDGDTVTVVNGQITDVS